MDDDKYNEILRRLTRIENLLKPLGESTSYGNKILSNIIGNMIWQWFEYTGRNSNLGGVFPPKCTT